jgi:hypothetical protein
MDIKTVEKHFARMGARVQVGTPANRLSQPFGIDIGTDKRGEFFDIQVQQPEAIEMLTLDIRPEMRHLLLMVRGGGSLVYSRCWSIERFNSCIGDGIVAASGTQLCGGAPREAQERSFASQERSVCATGRMVLSADTGV